MNKFNDIDEAIAFGGLSPGSSVVLIGGCIDGISVDRITKLPLNNAGCRDGVQSYETDRAKPVRLFPRSKIA